MSGGGPSDSSDKNWRPASTVGKPTLIEPGSDTGGGGGGGGAGGGNACLFTEITRLSSPNATVIATIQAGAVLDVHHQTQPSRVVVMTSSGQIAGSITSARLADIIECIALGQVYKARVTSIQGGLVTVEIYPQ
ncbi:hypothetical protein QTL95_21425 [Rhizobium sp. S152]|uniref:hypothetical protein n=1 Tax=Rhizobium sp. S152 TaxID=3055038 RepID=UPI0025A9F89E|nr:hypothetical protein [Rhizobium sp. S152]MDM9628461.1 hypothetical protein [Rhizobium sp. S152]